MISVNRAGWVLRTFPFPLPPILRDVPRVAAASNCFKLQRTGQCSNNYIMVSLVHILELTWGVSPQVVDRQSCSHCQRSQTSDAGPVHEDPPGKWFHGYYFMWNRIGLETKVFTDLSFSKEEVSPVRIKAIFLGLWLSEHLSQALIITIFWLSMC